MALALFDSDYFLPCTGIDVDKGPATEPGGRDAGSMTLAFAHGWYHDVADLVTAALGVPDLVFAPNAGEGHHFSISEEKMLYLL